MPTNSVKPTRFSLLQIRVSSRTNLNLATKSSTKTWPEDKLTTETLNDTYTEALTIKGIKMTEINWKIRLERT